MSADHAAQHVSATGFTVTIATQSVDVELNDAEVDSTMPARFARQDPDRGTNPDMKLRLGKGSWLVGAGFSGTAAASILQSHLYAQQKNDAAMAEVVGFLAQTLAGGGTAFISNLFEVTDPYADVELRVSNESGTTNIVLQGATLWAINVHAIGTARVHH